MPFVGANTTEIQTAKRIIELEGKLEKAEKMLDKADTLSRRSLKIAYISLGVTVLAAILSIIPFIKG
jgi:hypothetical protein